MDDRLCLIVGAGSFDDLRENFIPSLTIAADGGYRYLKEQGLDPDVLLGDFDSLEIVPEHRHLIQHSPIKDETDMGLAVKFALSKGYRNFALYGGLGGRMDHSLANLQLLGWLAGQGCHARLIGEGLIITAVYKEALLFSEDFHGMISVFALTDEAPQVSIFGMKYNIEDLKLTNRFSLGVSNEFTGQAAQIRTAGEGILLVMWDRENGPEKRIPAGPDHKTNGE